MTRFFLHTLLLFSPTYLLAQNITDLSVGNDRTADIQIENLTGLSSIDDSVFFHPDRISMDNRCVQIEGNDVFLFSGTFHYFRVPEPLWQDRFHKLKDAGFNCVETYVPWNWHERKMPKSPDDDSCLDMSDLEKFLNLAEKFGLYVIIRPGPYICAEWSGGGFPQWIMQKKPSETKFEVWLQSNDAGFMKWNEHWYRAVCRVVAPHQLTRKPKGDKGVILFQVENEFNRIKWFPGEEKKDYLEQLVNLSRKYGIDVPIITCWTDEARNVESGPLNGVVDMVNSYPRWAIDKNFGRLINRQLQSQPGKPLISGELQGGWYCDVAGDLSWALEGVDPVQTQNITLYALQRGFCAINYYMVVGGCNFDDWNGRQVAQTYDYAAAISEDGATNDRYRRFCGLSRFIKEHGVKIVRSDVLPTAFTSSDPDVTLVVRKTADGDRYYFIRTEEHTRNHFGTIVTEDFAFDFALEPFGAMVYYLPADSNKGCWYPQIPAPTSRPWVKSDTINLKPRFEKTAMMPRKWTKIKPGRYIDNDGIYGHHPILYKTHATRGRRIDVGYVGDKIINGTHGDKVLMAVDGRIIRPLEKNDSVISFHIPGCSRSDKTAEIILLLDSKGLHHHTNRSVEDNWMTGLKSVRCEGKNLPLEYAYTEKSTGESLSLGSDKEIARKGQTIPLLTWTTYDFTLPEHPKDVWSPYYLDIEHEGDGYIYLNGHCLGRCYQNGPQKSYYLPECWLDYHGNNTIAISLHPNDEDAKVTSAKIISVNSKAERR